MKMKMKNASIMAAALAAGLMMTVSCSKHERPGPGPEPVTTVKAAPLSYAGNGSVLEGENDIADMKACLFEGGVMTRVYENLVAGEDGYRFQFERAEGTLYLLANLDGMVDLNGMLASSVSEADFVRTAVAGDGDGNGNAVHFFTGRVELSESHSYTALLERGVARFDLTVSSAFQPLSVKSVEITRVAGKGFLRTPSTGIASPEDSGYTTASVAFDTPVTDLSRGFLYVYEQPNTGMEIRVTVLLNGTEKVMTKALEGDIARNSIYTVKVNKNGIDVNVSVSIPDWEDGADTEIEVFGLGRQGTDPVREERE